MAQVRSGSFNTGAYVSSSYSPRYYTFSWSLISQSIEGNYSDISWSLKGAGGSNDYYWVYVREKYVTVNGATQSNSDLQTTYNGTIAFSGTSRIYHNADGTKSFSASAGGAFEYYGSYNSTGSGTWELPTIPRYLTINSFNVSNITETTAVVSWSVSDQRNSTYYSLDGGTTWVGSATYGESLASDNKSGSFNIQGLSANTKYNIKIKIKRTDSGLWTESATKTITTYDYPHCTKAPNFTIGNPLNLEIYNPLNRSFNFVIIGNNGVTKGENNYNGTSVGPFTIEDWKTFFYSTIPNSKSGTYSVQIIYGSSTKSKTGGTYSVKGTEKPTIGTITYADTNSTVTAITGDNQYIVQNQSNLKVTYTKATPNNGAGSISKYTFTLNGVTKESTSAGGTIDFGKVNSASNITLTMTVTDSRGLTSSATKTITMLAHKEPTAIVTLKRLNNYEDESYLTVDGSISSINSKNTMTIKYRYKVSGGSYGNYTTISDNVKQTLSLDKNNIYIFNVVVTDAFGSTYNKEHTLGKGTFPLFIDTEKNSLGMNMFPRAENIFEIEGRIVESEKEFSIPTTIGAKTGWYLAMSGEFSYVTNKAFLIAIQQTMSGGAGLLYFNMRYYNNTLSIQRCEWLTYSGISSTNLKLKTEGNKFYLYLKTTANYQQYYLKVIQEKILDGWKFKQYTMHSPSLDDTVEEPTGTSPTYGINAYTTTERIIGTWFDGKPLYRKIIDFGYLKSGIQELAHNISNIDVIVNGNGFFHNTNTGSWYPIPRPYPTNMETYCVSVDVNKKNIVLTNGTAYNGTTFYAWIILEYTKTTD